MFAVSSSSGDSTKASTSFERLLRVIGRSADARFDEPCASCLHSWWRTLTGHMLSVLACAFVDHQSASEAPGAAVTPSALIAVSLWSDLLCSFPLDVFFMVRP